MPNYNDKDFKIKKINLLGNEGLLIFLSELIKHPGKIGAIVPSSKRLAFNIAHQIPIKKQGIIIEVGAGTGVITEALLKRGIPPKQLIVIERATALVKHLRTKFPKLNIIEGDALNLKKLLGKNSKQVYCIVSSLPLRSLPKEIVKNINQQFEEILNSDGILIQFTYSLSTKSPNPFPNFKRVSTKKIWMNIPPAYIEVYRKCDVANK